MTWQTETIAVPEPTDAPASDDPTRMGFRRWMDHVSRSFLQGRTSDGQFDDWIAVAHADGHVVRQVIDGDAIVGTFCDYPWRVSLGAGTIPFWAITDVGVAPTHRRRGMLRDMMTDSLQRAVDAGMPMAALTVSEGSIYGRFGFGVAGPLWRVELTARDVELRQSVPGGVRFIEPSDLEPHLEDLFETTRTTWPGIHPMTQHRHAVLGRYDWDADKVPTDRYAAVHENDAGVVDAALVWKYTKDGREDVGTVLLVECLWGAPSGIWSLLEFCANVDLIDVIVLPGAPPVDQLRAVLKNPRAVSVKRQSDGMWFRPLDIAACVAARPWGADGEVTIRITDPLGHAEGTWRIRVQDGRGSAERVTDDVSAMTITVDTFASLLGDARFADLALAGRVQNVADVAQVDRILGAAPTPWHNVGF